MSEHISQSPGLKMVRTPTSRAATPLQSAHNARCRVYNVLVLNDAINFSSLSCHGEDDCTTFVRRHHLCRRYFPTKLFNALRGEKKKFVKKNHPIHYISINRIRREFSSLLSQILSHDTAFFFFFPKPRINESE